MFGDADRAVFVSDFGSDVIVGAAVGRGTLRIEQLEEPDGAGFFVRVQRPTLRVVRGAFAAPSPDAAVTVDGTDYVFRGVLHKTPTAALTDSGMETWILAEAT